MPTYDVALTKVRMNEFRVKWQQRPHVQYAPGILFVEAADKTAAEAVVRDHIERVYGIAWYSIHEVEPYQRPTGGRVLGAGK